MNSKPFKEVQNKGECLQHGSEVMTGGAIEMCTLLLLLLLLFFWDIKFKISVQILRKTMLPMNFCTATVLRKPEINNQLQFLVWYIIGS